MSKASAAKASWSAMLIARLEPACPSQLLHGAKHMYPLGSCPESVLREQLWKVHMYLSDIQLQNLDGLIT